MSSNANMYTVHTHTHTHTHTQKSESNAFMEGEECVKEVILNTRMSNRWNKAAW